MTMLNVINPANEEIIADFSLNSPEQIELILTEVAKAFQIWSQMSISERSQPMKELSRLLLSNIEKFAHLITQEMGKPIVEARAEIKKCALTCNYFADQAENFLKEEVISEASQTSIISFEPLGIILGIMPWNYPFWQVLRFSIPTLMAGNAIVIKPALNVPGCSLAIEELITQAGFPENLLRNLFVDHAQIPSIIDHHLIKGVSLTGSDRAGKTVGSAAGGAIKKVVLELGGSDPYIVLADADLNKCVDVAIKARLQNAGQSCISAKRFIIVPEKMEEFCHLLLDKLKNVKMGDPLKEETTLGPLARKDLFEKFNNQIQSSIQKGAKLLLGGKPQGEKGYFYPPTVLRNVRKGMPAFDEETFGPLFAIIEARDSQNAIEIANDSSYGLGASLWTQNLNDAKELARRIQSGLVFINDRTVSDPKLPFGGIKHSGFGRELGKQGIKEFVNIKTIIMR